MSTPSITSPLAAGPRRTARATRTSAADGTPVPPPQVYARVAGVLYLVVILGGIFAEFIVRGSVVATDDAAETAANILDSEWLYRLGFASDLLVISCDVTLALLFLVLLRPVNEGLALLAAFFRLTQAAVLAVIALAHFSALAVLSDLGYLQAYETEQLNALALALLDVHTYGYDVALVFFGLSLFTLGYLVLKSGYLPRLLGALVMAGSVGYLVDSLTSLLLPRFDEEIAVVLIPTVVAEVALCLWLIVKGVKDPAADVTPDDAGGSAAPVR